mgnify:CR=1 FL=1
MAYEFLDLIDVDELQALTDRFCDIVGISSAIIDVRGKILIQSRWQPICSAFHRSHPETDRRCRISDTVLVDQLLKDKKYVIYRCQNGLLDAAAPIRIEGRHVANLFMGQFLQAEPDMAFFRKQARDFGFDETAYLNALKKVPIFEKKTVQSVLEYFAKFAEHIGEMGLKRIRQIEIADQLAVFKRFAEESEQGFCMADLDGNLTYVNSAFCRILDEKHPDDVIGQNIEKYFPAELKQKWREKALPRVLEGQHWLQEVPFTTNMGRQISTIQGIFAIHDNDGRLLCCADVITDITDRKQAEELLRESEERYRLVVENASEAIGVLRKGAILFANRTMIDTIGIHDNFCDCIHTEDRPAVERMLTGALEMNHSPELLKIRAMDARQSWRWFQMTATALDWQGAPAVLLLMTDIHSQTLAETTLKKAEQDLANAQKMEAIANLATGVAHDFHNYAQIIGTNVELLMAAESRNSPGFQKLKEIEHSVTRATELTNSLLMFRNEEEGTRQLVDINWLIGQISGSLDTLMPRNVTVACNLNATFKIRNADPVQITQVLVNLALNARDAMPHGGGINFETRDFFIGDPSNNPCHGLSPGKYVALQVADEGEGIMEADRAHIFEPFFTTKPTGEGAGLGLTNVYHIVRNHKGHITCSSELNKGTLFSIFFPATRSDAQVIQFPVGGHESVLLVDDDPYIAERGKEYLHSYGYTVRCALSGEEAFETYREHHDNIDLVIMDLVMPGMGGETCIAELLRFDPDVKILVASAYLTDELFGNGKLKDRIQGFVAKPYIKGRLLKAIRQVMDKHTVRGAVNP